VRQRVRELGWGALGFGAAFLLFVIGSALWGLHIEHRIDRITIQRVSPHHDKRPRRQRQVGLDVQIHPNPSKGLDNAREGETAPAQGGIGGAPAPGSTGDSGGASPHTGGKPAGHAPPKAPDQPSSTQPPAAAPAPVATAAAALQPEQAVAEEPMSPAPEASSAPGLIGNPGGVVGGLCPTLNRLLPVCE
jgi:hypothetical protein